MKCPYSKRALEEPRVFDIYLLWSNIGTFEMFLLTNTLEEAKSV